MFKLMSVITLIGCIAWSGLINAATTIITAPPQPPPPASLQDYDRQLQQSSQLPPPPPLIQPNTTTIIQQGRGPQEPSVITPVPNNNPAVIITPPNNGSAVSNYTPMVPNNVPLTPNYAPSNNAAGASGAPPANRWLAPNPWQTAQPNPWSAPSGTNPLQGAPTQGGPNTQQQQIMPNIYSPGGQSPFPPPVIYR